MGTKIQFAVVGCGHIGRRHIEMISRNESCALAAVADTDTKALEAISDLSARAYQSLEGLLAAEREIDVVVVATPNGLHFRQAMLSLQYGKHVVVEKPLALSVQDSDRLIAEAAKRALRIFAVMQNRFSPPAQWLHAVLSQGRLGRVYMVQLNCFWNRDSRYYTPGSWRGTVAMDGGTLYTQFSHFIDILFWLFGDISNICSKLADYSHAALTEFEDTGIITFDLEGGGMGSLNFTTSVMDSNLESSLTVIAEKGTVRIGGQYMDAVEICNIKDYELPELRPTNPANNYGSYRGSAANHHFIVEDVVRVLAKGEKPYIEPSEAVAVLDIIERMYAAAVPKPAKHTG